jgi:chemotaxis family two-component system sensor kinase Cph1
VTRPPIPGVPMPHAPATLFGKADLSNCEREQIHLAGSIQPHGALLVLREPDLVIVQSSANARAFLGGTEEPIGRSLNQLGGNLAARLREHLDSPLEQIPIAVRCRLGGVDGEVDCLMHRTSAKELIVELERPGAAVDFSGALQEALNAILGASSLRELCDGAATVFKNVTAYDRVMIYRFDEEGHGEVFAERRQAGLEPYLGNHYPASDIPQIARRLYERNRVRVLVDVEAAQVPLVPRVSPITGRDLDMSLCLLRSMSPLHIQYLKNMGVRATMVVSLMVGGRLWGLVACHHYVPRHVDYEARAACDLLAEALATRIAALESFAQAHMELTVRRLEQRMAEAIARDGDWKSALFDDPRSLLQPLDATGAALLFEGQVLTVGEVPGTPELREIGRWIDRKPKAPVISTASLGLDAPEFVLLTPVAAGVIATPLSSAPGDYLMWFRHERVRTVTWGGNPAKPFVVGNDPTDLSPRRSFAQWHQVVEGTCDPWTPADEAAARLISESVSDIVLQFRSVRMLIARDQLLKASDQVQISEQPVLVADPEGRILVTNESLDRLLGDRRAELHTIRDLEVLFAFDAQAVRPLRDLLEQRLPWRGEVMLSSDAADAKPVLIRADPVFASPERYLGFVIGFVDLTERKTAEAARRRFQEGIVRQYRPVSVRLDSESDVVYRNLLSTIVGNAQLAAMEITDGVDMAKMPGMLESVQASVHRTAELLGQLIWRTSGSGKPTD